MQHDLVSFGHQCQGGGAAKTIGRTSNEYACHRLLPLCVKKPGEDMPRQSSGEARMFHTDMQNFDSG